MSMRMRRIIMGQRGRSRFDDDAQDPHDGGDGGDGGGDDDGDDSGGDNDNGHHDIQGGDNQKFAFDGSSIRSELNGFVFDVEEGVMEEGSAVILWPHHGEDNQIFKFIEVS